MATYPKTYNFVKQPGEQFYLGFDFSDQLGTRTISSALVTATLSGENASAALIDPVKTTISGGFVYYYVIPGQSDGQYQITCVATLNNGDILEEDAYLWVQEY